MVSLDRLDFPYRPLDEDYVKPSIDLFQGDARNLDLIKDDSIDLVATHPPYAGIIKYTGERVAGDPSSLKLKLQHEIKSTREKWRETKHDFYLLAHEHLYVFRRPAKDEKMSEFKNSLMWR